MDQYKLAFTLNKKPKILHSTNFIKILALDIYIKMR